MRQVKTMKKVIINGDYLAFSTFAGVSRFATEILYEIDNLMESVDAELLTPVYAKYIPKFKNIRVKEYGTKPLLLWKQLTLPEYVKSNDGILLDLTQAFILRTKAITCVHDCIPELVSTAYSGILGKCVKKPIKLLQRRIVIKNSRAILTVSNHSKEDIIRIFKIKGSRITVVPNAWQHMERIPYDDSIMEKLGLIPKEFYFSLGSHVSHKNIEWIIEAAKQNDNSQFILSGERKYAKKKKKRKYPKNIRFTGYISDSEIRTLMANCRAFIFPSIYEGFGIPPLEALAEGAEIIISNKSFFKEIYSESAHYIDPNCYNDIDLTRIMDERVSSRQNVLKKYNWKDSAKILMNCLNDQLK